MARTVTGQIVLTEVFDGNDGLAPDNQLWIYQDASSQPSVPSPSASVPAGWTSTLPASVTDVLYGSLGVQANGTGNYTWGNIVQLSGIDGVIGQDGARGAGRFDKTITLGGTTIPAVGSTDFNDDAQEALCTSVGGTWTTSCSTTRGVPVEGDIIVITYFDSNGVSHTRGAIHDGTGLADNDWTTFAIQIDGSLLVEGTVVADSLTIGNSGGFYVDDNGHLTLRSITVTSPPAFNPALTYKTGEAVAYLGTEYICNRHSGCLGSDLASAPYPGLGENLDGWELFGNAQPAVTNFINAFDNTKTDYALDELVFHNGNMYACDNAGGCDGTTQEPGVSSVWETLVGGQQTSSSSRMVIDSNKIKIFDNTTNVITLGDLT